MPTIEVRNSSREGSALVFASKRATIVTSDVILGGANAVAEQVIAKVVADRRLDVAR